MCPDILPVRFPARICILIVFLSLPHMRQASALVTTWHSKASPASSICRSCLLRYGLNVSPQNTPLAVRQFQKRGGERFWKCLKDCFAYALSRLNWTPATLTGHLTAKKNRRRTHYSLFLLLIFGCFIRSRFATIWAAKSNGLNVVAICISIHYHFILAINTTTLWTFIILWHFYLLLNITALVFTTNMRSCRASHLSWIF